MSCFTRGYDLAREKTENGSNYIRNCQNCVYLDRENNKSREEVCLNSNVTRYDLIIDGGKVSCTQWIPYTQGIRKNSLFGHKKSGRDMFEILIGEE